MNYKFPAIDLVRTGQNITRLMEKNNIKVSDLQDKPWLWLKLYRASPLLLSSYGKAS